MSRGDREVRADVDRFRFDSFRTDGNGTPLWLLRALTQAGVEYRARVEEQLRDAAGSVGDREQSARAKAAMLAAFDQAQAAGREVAAEAVEVGVAAGSVAGRCGAWWRRLRRRVARVIVAR